MNTTDLIRKICKKCRKEYGVKVTHAQARAMLEALKEITYDECKQGGRIKIRGFMTIKGILTKVRKLPDGTYNIPRYRMKVELSEVLIEQFRKDVTGQLDDDENDE